MARTIEPIKIQDRDGTDHAYTQTLFPAEEGLRLAASLAATLGPAIGRALDSAGVESLSGLAEANIDLAGAVRELAQALPAMPDLAIALLRYTRRDGEQVGDKGAFSMAYAGNYAELSRACMWVVRENGFLDFFTGFGAMKGGVR